MKNLLIVFTLTLVFFTNSVAQEVQTVQLEQTKGQFTQQEVTLKAGTYIFEISNHNVDHKVGFVLAPKGKTSQKDHIKEAYVTKTIDIGEKSSSQEVTLEKGEYVYFCPLNPTPQYRLRVE
ncbi:cupredoxin domain-containing protein [Ascidiimonas sp. W6]|uniref:cupredoxin domain-containing protein n=1 Tax=Ascidiimonas meishanensis TaxID=3128903 RepID=UPI0030EF7C59